MTRESRHDRWHKATQRAEDAIQELINLQLEYKGWFKSIAQDFNIANTTHTKLEEVSMIHLNDAMLIIQEAMSADPPQGWGRDK